MILVFPCLNAMFFKFLFIHETNFANLSVNVIHSPQNFAREKWHHEATKILRGFVFGASPESMLTYLDSSLE